MLNHLALGGYIADTIREPLLVLDAEFRVVAANRAYFTAFHTTPLETIDHALFALGDGQWDIAELRRLLKEVLPEHRAIDGFPVEHTSLQLGARYMILNACEILRPEEHEYLILLAIDDLTERRAAELTLARRTRDLERSNRDLEQFAAIASHDLHEPLRKILTFGDLLQRTPDELSEKNRDYVTRMTHAAKRMQTLINELLALARLAPPQRMIAIDPSVTVSEVLVDLESSISDAGAIVDVGMLPMIVGDPTQVRQLFQNLIANALKFRRPGVVSSIRIGAFEAEEAAALGQSLVGVCVSDNGIGFEPRHAEVIFQPLERLHGRSEYAGSGMGLALARRIVEQHGGTIYAEGTPGEGSRFCLTLPRPLALAVASVAAPLTRLAS
jgi:two-component system CheB/CheR fusion protein